MIVLFSSLFIGQLRSEPQPRFFGMTKAQGDENGKLAEAYIPYFITLIDNNLKKSFPCAAVLFQSDVSTLLEHTRQLALLTGNDGNLKSIGESVRCDYLLSLVVIVSHNQATIRASCIDNKTSKMMANAMESGSNGDAGISAMEKVAEKLVKQIERYEICRFKGKVQLKVVTQLKKNEKDEYAVFCNNTDGKYRKTTTINNYSEQIWDLEKVGLDEGSGTMALVGQDESMIDEQDACHKCSSGTEGPWFYQEKTIGTTKIEGLSHKVIIEGVTNPPDADVRVSLTFKDDDTYFITLKAASDLGKKKIFSHIQAGGNCDQINKPDVNSELTINTALLETYGPYPGKAIDKNLTLSKEWKEVDPVSKEEKTITLKFDLKHD